MYKPMSIDAAFTFISYLMFTIFPFKGVVLNFPEGINKAFESN